MNAVMVAVTGLVLYVLAYQFYSRFIAERIYRLDPNFKTPAHELEDGTDYVPTNKHVLWGHHFTSVAGAAPIVGPAIAAFWGWLPAFLWVVFGTIFFAGVHDFGTLWVSSRHKGRSMGALTEDLLGPRARSLFLVVIFLLLLMVNAVFAIVIARLFVNFPGSVFPIWMEIPVAVLIGYYIHRRGGKLLWPSLAALVALYVFVWMGSFLPISLPQNFLGLPPQASWVIILFIYAGIASMLPVWFLLQPRDYINSHQLFVGLAILYVGLLIGNPQMVAPAINPEPTGAPWLVPFLFITIACGAISGFHGLVSSGTSSKQLDKETDARFVGYFGSIGEGILALGAILAVSAGLATTQTEWAASYSNWAAASGGAVGFFVEGMANFGTNLGLPLNVAQVLASVMVISFAATTMDTGLRLQRYVITEVGDIYRVPVLKKPLVATVIAAGTCLLLAFGSQAGGELGSGGFIIWPLFGTTNQLLAALSLIVVSVFLRNLGRNAWPTMIPMIFLLVMTVFAMLMQVGQWWGINATPNYLLAVLGSLILIAALWMVLEAFWALSGGGPGATRTAAVGRGDD
jgi:carbon starvation protein